MALKVGRTSEQCGNGHPDFVADIISDSLLDLALSKNEDARCGIETMTCTDEVIIRGEVGGVHLSEAEVEETVRETVKKLGYVDIPGFSFDTLKVNQFINQQSADIAMGVVGERAVKGAGDQGIMIGYACNETDVMLPIQFHICKELMDIHNNSIGRRQNFGIRPDAKCQFTLVGQGENTLVMSISHDENADIQKYLNHLFNALFERYPDYQQVIEGSKIHLNSTGRFVICGPAGDTGLTGRKIVCDAYGGVCPVGGGAFSGKDPSKVDRSAAYMARFLAKQIIQYNATPDKDCSVVVNLSYGIGIAEPTSIEVKSNFLDAVKEEELAHWCMNNFDLTPQGIIDFLSLKNIKYAPTAHNGHFGVSKFTDRHILASSFTWEKLA